MSREIKFRGKRVDNGEWVYGDLIKLSIIDPFTYIAKGVGYKVDDPEIGKPIKVLPDTVGQYTGLKDKNGVEIYERDIVRYNMRVLTPAAMVTGVVRFIDGAFILSSKKHLTVRRVAGGNSSPKVVEVIGNLYENPELLK